MTAAGAVAWIAAIVVAHRLRSTVRDPRTVPADASIGARASVVASELAGGLAGGLVAGVVVLGFGGRLLMRVLAATSPDRAQGRLTDAEEIVGEVTLGGTLGFVVFVGLVGGVLGAAGFGLLRRWLPERSVAAGAVAAAIGAGLLARPSGLLEPNNRDFSILEPAWLAVVLATALLLTCGVLGAALIDRWSARWPVPGRSVAGVAGMLPLVALVLVPPAAVAAAATVAVRTAVRARPWALPLDVAARTVVLAGAVVGAGWTLLAAVEIVA